MGWWLYNLFKFTMKKTSKNTTIITRKAPSPSEDKQSIKSEDLNVPEEQGSESVRVALRMRPLNELELSRSDSKIVKQETDKSIQINYK